MGREQKRQHRDTRADVDRAQDRNSEATGRPLPERVPLYRGPRALALLRRAEGGVVAGEGGNVRLTALEYALLGALVARRATAEATEAFVSARALGSELARHTDIRGVDVGELVRQLQRKLASLRASDVIETTRSRGHRLGWSLAPETYRPAPRPPSSKPANGPTCTQSRLERPRSSREAIEPRNIRANPKN
jgi:hypothetical protein